MRDQQKPFNIRAVTPQNRNAVNLATKELVLRLIDHERTSLVRARQLASAQLGQAHECVGEIGERIELLDAARREVSNVQARLA